VNSAEYNPEKFAPENPVDFATIFVNQLESVVDNPVPRDNFGFF
jgi:hypothetical protein